MKSATGKQARGWIEDLAHSSVENRGKSSLLVTVFLFVVLPPRRLSVYVYFDSHGGVLYKVKCEIDRNLIVYVYACIYICMYLCLYVCGSEPLADSFYLRICLIFTRYGLRSGR